MTNRKLSDSKKQLSPPLIPSSRIQSGQRGLRAMWIIFSIFAILWFLGIYLYFPPAASMTFFGLMLVAAVIAVWKTEPASARRR